MGNLKKETIRRIRDALNRAQVRGVEITTADMFGKVTLGEAADLIGQLSDELDLTVGIANARLEELERAKTNNTKAEDKRGTEFKAYKFAKGHAVLGFIRDKDRTFYLSVSVSDKERKVGECYKEHEVGENVEGVFAVGFEEPEQAEALEQTLKVIADMMREDRKCQYGITRERAMEIFHGGGAHGRKDASKTR